MNDLISRKALLECFDPDDKEMPWAIAVRSRIIQQPIAYDLDKVVEQLVDMFYEYCDITMTEDDFRNDVSVIVKKGGL